MKVTTNTPPQVTANQAANQSEIEKTKSAAKANPASGAFSSIAKSGTAVDLSDEARLFQMGSRFVAGLPDLQNPKLAAIKKSVADGTYRVDSSAIAEKLLDDHFATDFGKNNL